MHRAALYTPSVRIASLSPAATEILFAIGAGEQIVCRDQFSNFPEEAKKIPQLMGHQAVEIAALRAAKPDLVLTATVIQRQLADGLKAAGFSAVHQDPRTVAGVLESMLQIGILVDREQQAKALTAAFSKELTTLKHQAKLLPKKMKVYIEEWHQPPMVSGNWVPELVVAAGGIPFPIPAGELSREVTLEEVGRFDPDGIVVSWCGAGLLADKSLLTLRQGWGVLRAVQSGRVKVIDDSLLNRPGPRLVDGAKRLYGWFAELAYQGA